MSAHKLERNIEHPVLVQGDDLVPGLLVSLKTALEQTLDCYGGLRRRVGEHRFSPVRMVEHAWCLVLRQAEGKDRA